MLPAWPYGTATLNVIVRILSTMAIVTVDDPNIWTRSWTGSSPWARSDGPLFEYACHEGNYGLMNILAGSRAAEQFDQGR